MRTLVFNVKAQRIEKDPACDFKGIVAGSNGYLEAKFNVDAAWRGCRLAADFIVGDTPHGVKLEGGVCKIPADALTGPVVGVRLKGMRRDYAISTNVVSFRQEVIL